MKRREFLTYAAALATPAAFPDLTRCWGQEAEQEAPATRRPASGPLKKHPQNPRYFANAEGKAVLLTGSHTWNSLVDIGEGDPPPQFDFDAYLDFLVRYDHNFIRLWTWEINRWDARDLGWGGGGLYHATPQPWARTGPAAAADGKPKYDLTRFDPAYFQRLRTRVAAAQQRGIYVSIMLFEGWALQFAPEAWPCHPLHPANHINDLEPDWRADTPGVQVHELSHPSVTRIQEAYVRHVIDTVNDLDNVLYEISNENHTASTPWQYHMIDFVHKYEREKSRQHPVGMTFQYQGGSNQTLRDSPADWISPNPDGGYSDNPPAADGHQVILSDTDHLWGIGGNIGWVWKSVLRGLNPLFMDPYDGTVLGKPFDPQWEPIRGAMGVARRLTQSLDLAALTPQNQLASTGYCLAQPGRDYLVYLPEGGDVTVDLSQLSGEAKAHWIDLQQGTAQAGAPVSGGRTATLRAPQSGAALVRLTAQR